MEFLQINHCFKPRFSGRTVKKVNGMIINNNKTLYWNSGFFHVRNGEHKE
jgi:hypothetical protein